MASFWYLFFKMRQHFIQSGAQENIPFKIQPILENELYSRFIVISGNFLL